MTEREFRLPDLGEGLEEARILAWLVAEGDEVALNQPFVEVETAKADIEIPSPFAGRVTQLHAAVGDAVPVGAPLVTIDAAEAGGGPVAATPAVRKLARELGVNVEGLTGTGPEGRLTREDVERAAGGGAPADADRIGISAGRRQMAENLERAYAVPQVTTFRTVDCSELEALRHELRISPLPVVVRALAEVCLEHPTLNATWTRDAILVHRRVNVGVAADTERGLVVPVVHDAQERSIGEIAADIDRLAAAARERSLAREDLIGATITVTNTGSYGSEFGTPVLNPGNAVTLGLGVIAPRALVVGGEPVARPACTLSLTFDHRILDGATIGRALGDLVDLLQDRGRLRRLPA